jgi:hypothetical protein
MQGRPAQYGGCAGRMQTAPYIFRPWLWRFVRGGDRALRRGYKRRGVRLVAAALRGARDCHLPVDAARKRSLVRGFELQTSRQALDRGFLTLARLGAAKSGCARKRSSLAKTKVRL